MSFAARQQELVRHLQWGPRRGRRRRAMLDELRALVHDELQRETAAARTMAERQLDHNNERQPRRFYWLDQEDDQ